MTRGRQLALVAVFEVMVMSLWFSASAVVPQLRDQWHLSSGDAAWLTTSVQLGFVTGALASAMLNLPDRMSVRRLMALADLADSHPQLRGRKTFQMPYVSFAIRARRND